jgi:glycosyltransferase involved in cell wall biosynthesis
MRLLMISGDPTVPQGKKGVFYNMLAEFSKYWDEISVICPAKKGSKQITIHEKVTFYPENTPHLFGAYNIYKRGAKLLKGGYNLISVHESPMFQNGIAAYLLWKRFKIPYILEFHHISGYPKAADLKETIARTGTKIYLRFLSFVWKNAKAIRVVNNEEVPGFLVKHGVKKNKIKFIPSFYINFGVFKPLNFEKNGKSIVFCGRLVRNKGLFELLEAVKIVKEKYPSIKLTIVGTGPLEEKLKRISHSLGLSRSVDFKGWVPEDRVVAEIYNRAIALVMASYNEGGPRVTLEAMACGTPVISTKVGIMKELIKDGENGLFTTGDPEDIAGKIIFLLENDKIREKIAINGRETVQEFEYKKMIKNYAITYQRLAGSK